MSGGFFRGTSAEQDTRFSNKQAKLLKTQKFPPELDHVVDITKVKMDVINPWIAKRVTELLGFEDEVLINFINGLLEGKDINGKQIQIQLTGFMEKHTGKFMKELWSLLISAQNNASGVPQQFLDAKEEETRKKKEELDRIGNEMQKRREKEAEYVNIKMDGGVNNDYSATGPNSKFVVAKDSNVVSDDEKEAGIKNGFRRNSRSSRSPQPANRHSSPHRGSSRHRYRDESLSPRAGLRRSRSRSRSPVRLRSRSPRRPWRRHRSPFPSPRRRRPSRSRSPSPRRRRRSPPPASWRRRSRSPRRRHNVSPSPRRRRSISPRKNLSPSPLRRSPSPSPSPVTRHRRRSPSSSPSPPRRNLSPSPSAVTRHRRRSPSSSSHSPPPLRNLNSKRPSSSPPNQQHRSSSPQTHPSLSPHLLQSPTDKERYRTPDAVHRGRGRGRDSARDHNPREEKHKSSQRPIKENLDNSRHHDENKSREQDIITRDKTIEEPSAAAVLLSPIDEHKEDEELLKLTKKHTDSKKRKHRKSSRSESSGDDSETKEANKRRRKEEKKSRRDERRRRREERRRRKEEKRAHKRRSKDSGTESSSSDKHENDVSADAESEKKRVENELREKALQNIRAKKGIAR